MMKKEKCVLKQKNAHEKLLLDFNLGINNRQAVFCGSLVFLENWDSASSDFEIRKLIIAHSCRLFKMTKFDVIW